MRILLLGSTGQLGQELARQIAECKSADYDLISPLRRECDLTSPKEMERFIAPDVCDICVNAAAYTSVDRAESEPEQAWKVNCEALTHIGQRAAQSSIPVIHISTDYVFSGQSQEPYGVADPIGPIGVYGSSKAAGEVALRLAHESHVIIRTSWLYSARGQNFLRTMLRLSDSRDEVRVVNDQWGSPTSARDLSRAVLAVVEQLRLLGERSYQLFGTYHFSNSGVATWHAFAETIFHAARRYGCRATAVPISTAEYPTQAKRPKHSVLSCGSFARAFGVAPRHWSEPIPEVIGEIFDLKNTSRGLQAEHA